jgi:hypothetical protein
MTTPRIPIPNIASRWYVDGDHAGVEVFTPAKGEESNICDTCKSEFRDHGVIGETRICPGDVVLGGGTLRAWPMKSVMHTPTIAPEI